jgi:hypothetical protein
MSAIILYDNEGWALQVMVGSEYSKERFLGKYMTQLLTALHGMSGITRTASFI